MGSGVWGVCSGQGRISVSPALCGTYYINMYGFIIYEGGRGGEGVFR